jgi:hypothetical protein
MRASTSGHEYFTVISLFLLHVLKSSDVEHVCSQRSSFAGLNAFGVSYLYHPTGISVLSINMDIFSFSIIYLHIHIYSTISTCTKVIYIYAKSIFTRIFIYNADSFSSILHH